MRPEGPRGDDVRAWLRKADSDLRAAAFEISDPKAALFSDVVFQPEQAVEKSLKAFLAWNDAPFRKTHNLEELGRSCAALDGSLRTIVDRAVPLTEYAWKFRYPGDPEEPSEEEAREALSLARAVFEAVVSRLPSVRPLLP